MNTTRFSDIHVWEDGTLETTIAREKKYMTMKRSTPNTVAESARSLLCRPPQALTPWVGERKRELKEKEKRTRSVTCSLIIEIMQVGAQLVGSHKSDGTVASLPQQQTPVESIQWVFCLASCSSNILYDQVSFTYRLFRLNCSWPEFRLPLFLRHQKKNLCRNYRLIDRKQKSWKLLKIVVKVLQKMENKR